MTYYEGNAGVFERGRVQAEKDLAVAREAGDEEQIKVLEERVRFYTRRRDDDVRLMELRRINQSNYYRRGGRWS